MKATAYLVDAGPLIAALDADDQHHAWARAALDGLDAPILTCEAVVSEAWFLARRGGGDPGLVLDFLRVLDARIVPVWGPRVEALLRHYANRASVADAALLTLAEAEPSRVVVTTDRVDFSIYRLHGKEAVPSLMPPV
ncbi:MAG: PIN domain-containing protein [Bacteroidota bacterium]